MKEGATYKSEYEVMQYMGVLQIISQMFRKKLPGYNIGNVKNMTGKRNFLDRKAEYVKND